MKIPLKTIFLPQTLCDHSSKAPSPPPARGSLTDGLAHSCGGIHLVAAVALALVASFQVDADLTADAGVLALVDVYARREDGDGEKTGGKASRLINSAHA